MEAVYIIGRGSRWGNLEIRFSVRSLLMHGKVEKIYFVGYDPGIFDFNHDMIEFIPINDTSAKERNIWNAIFIGSKHVHSEYFLLCHDDHFIMRDLNDEPIFPYYFKKDKKPNHNHYRALHERTKAALILRGKQTKNFECHCPIHVNKTMLEYVALEYEKEINSDRGILFNSTYSNHVGLLGTEITDLKIYSKLNVNTLTNMTIDVPYFSISDTAINNHLLTFLENLYPNKAEFEL